MVDGTRAATRLLYLLLGVADGAAAGLHFRGLAASLLSVLLLGVIPRDRAVALLERALLHPRLDPTLLLPLFQAIQEGLRVVGPVQLAAVVDLGGAEGVVFVCGGYLRVHRVEVGRAGAADGALGRLALRHIAAHVALEAVPALGHTMNFFLNLSRDASYVALVLGLAESATA